MFILNAFSLNMVPFQVCNIAMMELSVEGVQEIIEDEGLESGIGHPDTAKIIGNMIGIELPVNRANITLKQGDKVLIGQYMGPRLPEGATVLPEGARIKFIKISVTKAYNW